MTDDRPSAEGESIPSSVDPNAPPSEDILWVSVEGTPTAEELEELSQYIDDAFDTDVVVSTKVVEPIEKSELIDYFESLVTELKDDD